MANKIQTITKKQGFTIIEVVLVLAIAGLIFLMVFIALPNMQRSQRDTQRRNDYSALSSAITQYTTNNNGRLPKAGATLDPAMYINSEGTDPNGLTYVLSVVEADDNGGAYLNLTKVANTSDPTQVYIVRSAKCEFDDAKNASIPKAVSSTRAFAIYGNLETGNGTYCQASAS